MLPASTGWKFVPAEFVLDSSNWQSAPHRLSFSPFENTRVNQDFLGIRMGDVNGDWHLASAGSRFAKENPLAFERLFSTKMTRIPRSVLNFEINLSVGLNAFGLSFYIPPQLKFNGIQKSGFSENFLIQHELTENVLRLAGAGTDNSGTQQRLILSFQLNSAPNPEQAMPIRIIDYCYNDSPVYSINHPLAWASATEIPEKFDLLPNYPNPFNAGTIIRYQLPEKSRVTVKVFNSLGQAVRTVVDQQNQAGYFEVVWDGKDDNRRTLSSGIYLCHFQAGQVHQVQKMVLLR